MHSQMHSQTLQALRAEIEAVTTLQLALNRIALSVEPDSVSVWDGPRPEDVDDVAADDGSFSREAVSELRSKAGAALAERYKEVERVVMGRAALESLVRSTLATGTGGVIATDGPPAPDVLSALARSGALRLDWAQEAAAQVRSVLDAKAEGSVVAAAKKTKKPVAAAKKKPVAAAKKKKTVSAAKKKVVVAAKKKPVAAAKKKKPAPPKKKPAAKKKR
jgi:hypothetical protein